MPYERGVSADEEKTRGAVSTPDFTISRGFGFCKVLPKGVLFLNYKQAVDYIKNIEKAGSD